MIDGGAGPGSGRDNISDDHGSNLTESTLDDENYISLLQYRDAHHVLNLPKASSSLTTTPNDVQKAYDIAKEQVELALHQLDYKHHHSQSNYLELKLQALDQAYDELMPSHNDFSKEGQGAFEESGVLLGEGIESRDTSALVMADNNEEEEEPFTPKVLKREYVWGDTNNLQQQQKLEEQLQTHKRDLSEDEICGTIDIYFRPKREESSIPAPPDMSTCTWDGSSLFSIISGTKKNGGTSLDNSRPLSDSGTGSKESDARPTLGIIDVKVTRSKKGPPKAQISPTSVTEYPATIHGNNHYEDTILSTSSISSSKRNQKIKSGSSTRRGKGGGGGGKIINTVPHESIEAARMGILRALSEENSECLTLDDDEYERYCNDYKTPPSKKNVAMKTMKKTNTNSDRQLHEMVRAPIAGKQQQHLSSSSQDSFQFWGSKSDSMPKDSNSLMMGSACDSIQDNNMTKKKEWRSKSASPLSTQLRNQKSIDLHPKTSNEQQLRPSTNSNFDDMLQVAMELADELCMMVNNCWKGNDIHLGSPISSPSRVVSSYNHRFVAQPEDESTLYSAIHHNDLNTLNTTYDESTYITQRSIYESTDGESTAFNTDSSFEHRQHHNDSQKKLSMNGKQRSGQKNRLDPPERRMM